MTEMTDSTDTAADASFELARRQGYLQAVEDVATWLETCVGRVGLWHRTEIAGDLRDGSWRDQKPLKGLRRASLLERRAQTLLHRGVPETEWPAELREFVAQYRARAREERADDAAAVARILRDKYGMDAPG